MRFPRKYLSAFVSFASLALTAASLAQSPIAATHRTQKVVLHPGQPPVANAHVYLYALGTGGPGTTASSLLQPGATTAPDGDGHFYVTTGNHVSVTQYLGLAVPVVTPITPGMTGVSPK